MADRPYELLVHTTAPLARNEALYRSLAGAYFEFTGNNGAAREVEAEEESYVVEQHATMADASPESQRSVAQSRSQQPEHDTLQAFMLPDGAASWTPDLQFESEPKKTYLTRSRIATSSAAPPPTSQASFTSTFTGTLDGMNSPRFRMPPQVSGPAYQWPSQTQSSLPLGSGTRSLSFSQPMPSHATPRLPDNSQAQSSNRSSSFSFHPPPSTVPDSQSQGYNPVPEWATSQVVMESFLGYFHSGTSTSLSSPSVRRSQRSIGTVGSLGSHATQGEMGQMPVDSSNEMSYQSTSIRPDLLKNRRPAPQVSPPKPRRKEKQAPPGKAQSSKSPNSKAYSPISGQVLQPRSFEVYNTDAVTPAPSESDEQPAVTFTTPVLAHGQDESTYLPQQRHSATRGQLPVPNKGLAAVTSSPAPADTPSRDLRKRTASNSSLHGSPPRPAKRPTTHVSRLQAISEVPRTPSAATDGAPNALHQVPFSGSFSIPASRQQLKRIIDTSFVENISRVSDTPPDAISRHKLSPVKHTNEPSKPVLPLNTSISIVPDTPTPALNGAKRAKVHLSSSALPLPSAPPSSAITASKPSSNPYRSSSHPHTTHEIHPPPPQPSHSPLTTFLTPFLTKIASQMSYSRYDPQVVTRQLRKDERGYWAVTLPDDVGGWSESLREETWTYLEKIVGRGRAGWGVHMYRANWVGDGKEEGWRGEEWRVYCWGEVVREVYLLLFLASSRKVRGMGARWVDADAVSVVRMGGERRMKDGGK